MLQFTYSNGTLTLVQPYIETESTTPVTCTCFVYDPVIGIPTSIVFVMSSNATGGNSSVSILYGATVFATLTYTNSTTPTMYTVTSITAPTAKTLCSVTFQSNGGLAVSSRIHAIAMYL